MIISLIFLHLLDLFKAIVTADGLGLLVQHQHKPFVAAGGAAVLTFFRSVPTETFQAGVAAKLVDSFVQGQLTFGLEKITIKEQ